MLVKLYKQDGDRRLYWEAWDSEGQVIFHTGELGQRGSTEQVAPAADESVEAVIEAGVEAARQRGFEPVPAENMWEIILACPTKADWSSEEKEGVGHFLEDLCNQCLGWTGLGHCVGPALRRGYVDVLSLVVDLDLGIREIIAELRRHGCEGKDEELVLSVPEGNGFRVVYTTGQPSGSNFA
jgi:hypothetical protein